MQRWLENLVQLAGLDSNGDWLANRGKSATVVRHTHKQLPAKKRSRPPEERGSVAFETHFRYLRACLHVAMLDASDAWPREMTDTVSEYLTPWSARFWQQGGPGLPIAALDILPGSIQFPAYAVHPYTAVFTSAVQYEYDWLRFAMDATIYLPVENNRRLCNISFSFCNAAELEALVEVVMRLHQDWCIKFPTRGHINAWYEATELRNWTHTMDGVEYDAVVHAHLLQPHLDRNQRSVRKRIVVQISHIGELLCQGRKVVRPKFHIEAIMDVSK